MILRLDKWAILKNISRIEIVLPPFDSIKLNVVRSNGSQQLSLVEFLQVCSRELVKMLLFIA